MGRSVRSLFTISPFLLACGVTVPYTIRKLKLGGILDQAVTLVRNHFGLLFGILLFLYIPLSVIAAAFNIFVIAVPANPTPEDYGRILETQRQYWPITVGLALLSVFLIVPLTNAAMTYAIAETYLGRKVTPGEALGRGFGKIGPLIWTWILMGAAIMGGLILLIIPGILCMLWFGLAQYVVVLEDKSGGAALSRSKKLVQPNMGTFLILGIVLVIIAAMLGGIANFIPQIHVKTAVQILINSVVTMFSISAFVVFYFSCRCGVDNYDLEHLAAEIEAGAALEQEEEETPAAGDERWNR